MKYATLERSEFAFPVEVTPLFATREGEQGTEIIKKKAVLRTDTHTPLGVVSNKYELLRHGDVVDSFRSALDGIEDVREKIQLTKKGAVMYATYTMGGHRVEVRKGDVCSLQFVVKNSYDGSNALQIMLGAYRLVCTNGMVIGKNFFTYSQKHVGSGAEIKVEVLQEKIGMLTQQFERTLPYLQEMSRAQIRSEITVEQLFSPEYSNLPEYLLKESQKQYEAAGDPTRWGYYNSLTYAITHNSRKDNPQTILNHGKVAWEIAQEVPAY